MLISHSRWWVATEIENREKSQAFSRLQKKVIDSYQKGQKMGRKSKYGPIRQLHGDELCSVCNNIANGYHYGALTEIL